MATTHKQSPQQIAQAVIAENGINYVQQDPVGAMMLAIAAYNDASNQRPENLAEACARLGVNLHWKSRGAIARSDWASARARFFVFIGMPEAPYAAFETEEQTILDLEQTVEQVTQFGVQIWVEAVL